MRGYLVHYLKHRRRGHCEPPPPAPERGTIVLQEIHPLAWASYPPATFHENFYREVLSWQEFDCADSTWLAVIEGPMDYDCLDDMLGAARAVAEAGSSTSCAAGLYSALSFYASSLRRELREAA